MRLSTFRPLRPFDRLPMAAAPPAPDPTVGLIFSKFPAAQGWWFDNGDLGTMFQDADGTIPVTAAGQPVGLQLDKSGRGNHRRQTTTTARPTLQQDAGGNHFLLADGIDDTMQTIASVDFSGGDEMTLCAGMQPPGSAGYYAGLRGGGAPGPNAFLVAYGMVVGDKVSAMSTGNGGSQFGYASASMPATPGVFSALAKIGGNSCIARRNGVQTESNAAAQGGGSYGNYPVDFFAMVAGGSTGYFFAGRDYGSACIGKQLQGSDLAVFEAWAAERCGVSL